MRRCSTISLKVAVAKLVANETSVQLEKQRFVMSTWHAVSPRNMKHKLQFSAKAKEKNGPERALVPALNSRV